jgi:hydroxymethylpyrimidine pyrophosphatase-like HAD family hydrolase
MLTWAGRPYIVANAHPFLLELGFPTVPSNTDSGVGRTISRWLS